MTSSTNCARRGGRGRAGRAADRSPQPVVPAGVRLSPSTAAPFASGAGAALPGGTRRWRRNRRAGRCMVAAGCRPHTGRAH